MKTIISINEISIDCIIGVSEQERANKQELLVSVELEVDAQKASNTDNIQDALVDYKKVYEKTIEIVSESNFYLLERLSKTLVDSYISMQGVLRAKVAVKKPNRLPKTKGVAVTMQVTK